MLRTFLAATLMVMAQAGQAQIGGAGLPAVRLPQVPGVGLPDLARTAGAVDTQVAVDVRRLRIRDLLRTQATVVEADPRGDPVMRGEVLAFSPSDGALDRARAAGYSVLRERSLDGLDSRIVVLQVPPRISIRRALRQLRSLDPGGTYDFNHLYFESGELSKAVGATERVADARPSSASTSSGKLGLIDGGVEVDHPVFHAATIHQHGCDSSTVPSEHGTAVASLLMGHAVRFRGADPGAELYAADVYCGRPAGGAVDAVADAFAWLVRERVPVINISLVGPPNAMLEAVVLRVVARGALIVAAVGNDGPAAPPLYPAAYRDVIGVTAVDARQHVLIEAGRGPQVKFAAPGADMAAACLAGKFSEVRGTSFAAPIVAGLLAADMAEPGTTSAQRAVAALISSAIDLGARGPDKVYGNGLVGESVRPELALATEPARPELTSRSH